jgi:hypothetical protein
MGTVTQGGNIEERIRAVEDKVGENTSTLKLMLGNVLTRMKESITELRILNLHQSVTTNEVFTEQDVPHEN